MLIKDIDCGKGLSCTVVVVVGVGAAQPYYYVRLLAPALAGKRLGAESFLSQQKISLGA